MALKGQHQETLFGIGDKVRVIQRIKEAGKERSQTFEGIVISIRGRDENKSFMVRRVGAQQIGIERIFPLASPTIEKIEIARKGMAGVRHAKLYYLRGKAKREIEKIYSRVSRQGIPRAPKAKKKKTSKKRPAKRGKIA